jgi:hypothetical protein
MQVREYTVSEGGIEKEVEGEGRVGREIAVGARK